MVQSFRTKRPAVRHAQLQVPRLRRFLNGGLVPSLNTGFTVQLSGLVDWKKPVTLYSR